MIRTPSIYTIKLGLTGIYTSHFCFKALIVGTIRTALLPSPNQRSGIVTQRPIHIFEPLHGKTNNLHSGRLASQ